MKKHLLVLFGFFVSPFLFSQILTINSGSSISISSNSSITLDGLEISPDDTYVISGDIDISRTGTPVISGSNTSVSRVYNSSDLLSGFTGTLTFSYLEGELDGITENELVLELQSDDDSWISYTGTVDEVNNTVSYTFNDPVSFKSVTASSSNGSLTIEDIEEIPNQISVYPNPTANRIYIQGENILQTELFDLRGRKVKTTNQKQIDMSEMGIGTFILKVTTDNNNTKSFKIIKK
ncbi:MAG: T9SS type A sorting domain-containing protein [Flavobacteriaceae bacterium]|nr:T9SS type A sorting domain-containing protein [Flavobacteriaceae bacterium]